MGGHRRQFLGIVLALVLVGAILLGGYALRNREKAGAWQSSGRHEEVAEVFQVLERQGLGASLDALERAAARDSVVLRDGHQLAHALGRRALERAQRAEVVLGQCRPVFASGCYHGVVEAFLEVAQRIDMAELGRLCAAAGNEERPAPVYECTHGLGHGVLGAVGFDTPSALLYCDALTGARLATSCREGVFMEAINSVLVPSRSRRGNRAHEHGASSDKRLTLDRSNPYAPCDRFADPYATSCWLFQGFVILRYRSFDPAEAFRTCDGAPAGRLERCYESVGFQLTGVFQRDDEWIIQQCAQGRPQHAPQCAAGAAAALAGVDWSGGRAAAFCAASPIEWKEPCYRALGRMLEVLASPGRRTEVCGSVEQAFVGACREAAGT